MESQHFTLHEVAAGVWGAEGDLTGASVGNAAIVDIGDRTIVVDTFMTDVAARDLRRAAEALTGKNVHLAINSHWHADHTNGNQVFADVPIVSTRESLDMIVATAPQDIAAWQAEIDATIESLREAADGGDEVAARRLLQHRHFRTSAGDFRLTLPDLLIDGRLEIAAERAVVIETRGKGHTVSDTYVWLPDDRILITGDLCWNGIHPRLDDGFPTAWAEYAQDLIDLNPAQVIPGHGTPGSGDMLRDLPAYFRTVDRLVAEVAAGTDPEEIEAPRMASDWDGLTRLRSGLAALAGR